MVYQKKVGVYFIIIAGLLTGVILASLQFVKMTVLCIALGYYLLPYFIMFVIFRKTKQDMYATFDLGILIFSIVGGLSLLINTVSRGPLGLLYLPIVQLLAYLILQGIVVCLRIFAKDMRYADKAHKDDQ